VRDSSPTEGEDCNNQYYRHTQQLYIPIGNKRERV